MFSRNGLCAKMIVCVQGTNNHRTLNIEISQKTVQFFFFFMNSNKIISFSRLIKSIQKYLNDACYIKDKTI